MTKRNDKPESTGAYKAMPPDLQDLLAEQHRELSIFTDGKLEIDASMPKGCTGDFNRYGDE